MANQNSKNQQWNNMNKALSKTNNKGKFYNSQDKVTHEKFTRICLSLVDSKPFRELTTTQKWLYVCMSLQVPSHDKKLIERYGQNAFYFNWRIQQNFGLLNHGQNIKNIRILAQKGFIEIKEDNHHNKKRNIYCLSSKWYTEE